MEVDIQSLGTFQNLARRGAESAAESFSELTGRRTCVDVTNVTVMSRDDLVGTFEGREFAGVRIGLEGLLSGEMVLVFDRENARAIADVLVPGTTTGAEITGLARSGIEEAGNIMTSGFVDGWANYLGTRIDMTSPEYVEPSGAEFVPRDVLDGTRGQHVLVFESGMEVVDEALSFDIYMLPESDALLQAVDDHNEAGGQPVPLDKLSVFNEMTRRGTAEAAGNITSMTGIETSVDVSRLSFAPVSSVPDGIDERAYVGLVFAFTGTPSGYLAFLFDESSARTLATELMPMDTGAGWGDMEESAMKELGNIMTSGFIDGWANVLETTIDHSPPQFVHDAGPAILRAVANKLDRGQRYAFVVGSTVRTADREVACDIYALPDAEQLRRALEAIRTDWNDHVQPGFDA